MTIVVISAGAEKPSKTSEAARLLAGPLDPNTPWLQVDGKTWIDGDLYGLQSAGTIVVKVTRWLLKQVRAVVIVLSTRTEGYLRKNGFDLPGTQIIPNGVDITRFQPALPKGNSTNRPEQSYAYQKRAMKKVSMSSYKPGTSSISTCPKPTWSL